MTAPRRLRVLLATAIAGLALTLTGAPAATALPAPQDAGAVRTDSNSSVENFRYSSWDVDVDVDVTDEGRAIANITETIVAEFPETEQNRGIIRRIPQDYLGARTDPRNITVTDARGAAVPFEVERGSDDETDSAFVGVLTGTDDYVHGRQTYVLSYTLDDVILHRDDQQADEFYWDLVPLNRAQAIDSATGSVTFSPRLAAQLTGAQRCYAGAFEAQTECTLETGDAPGSITVAPLPSHPTRVSPSRLGSPPEPWCNPQRDCQTSLLTRFRSFSAAPALPRPESVSPPSSPRTASVAAIAP
ncbi:DUF2207 domain-containing protein [Leucobacter luti]|uniref:DUF2207 domain-containing protein n=1 Tax=Leucobacter luti TaxID=340320 RepID=UPI0037BF028A